MELVSVSSEIYEVSKRLQGAISTLFKLAKEKAETERDYRIEVSKAIFELKSEGMPASLIGDVSKGKCADWLFKRDLAEAKYRAAIESIGALQSQLSALQSVLRYHTDV